MQETLDSKFDDAAEGYDEAFTHSLIGSAQRREVWRYLLKALGKRPLRVLEINCGTGEDAIKMAEMGHDILATDLSHEMIRQAKLKVGSEKRNLSFKVCDMNDLKDLEKEITFDLILSNFGGLNCLSPEEIVGLQEQLNKILSPHGKLVWVVMPKYPLIEMIKMGLKFDFKSIRRKENSLEVNVNGNKVTTWYYGPAELLNLLKKNFRLEKLKPIGLFIPPSYMNKWVQKHRNVFRIMTFLESWVARWSWQAGFSDHYYLEMTRK